MFNKETVDLLTERAHRLHIGTHQHQESWNRPIEKKFKDRGWTTQWFYYGPRNRTNDKIESTDFGPVQFNDGVVSMVNQILLVANAQSLIALLFSPYHFPIVGVHRGASSRAGLVPYVSSSILPSFFLLRRHCFLSSLKVSFPPCVARQLTALRHTWHPLQ